MDRRDFMRAAMAAMPAAALLGARAQAQPKGDAEKKSAAPPICVFSKHLQFLDYPALAKACREVGLDGIDLTVRRGGHVLPERVAEDLPRAMDAIRGEGLSVPMITTRFESAEDEHLRAVLEAASAQGIRYFRVGGQSYRPGRPILEQLEGFAKELGGLAKVAAEYGMVAGFHNHSGRGNLGAPVWDLHRIYEMVDSPALGSNYDLGHATVEGAYGDWEITTALIAPHVKMAAVKDFVFDGSRPRWAPLGEGVVETVEMLRILRRADFAGPISIHFEYKIRPDSKVIDELREAVPRMRGYLKEAGFPS